MSDIQPHRRVRARGPTQYTVQQDRRIYGRGEPGRDDQKKQNREEKEHRRKKSRRDKRRGRREECREEPRRREQEKNQEKKEHSRYTRQKDLRERSARKRTRPQQEETSQLKRRRTTLHTEDRTLQPYKRRTLTTRRTWKIEVGREGRGHHSSSPTLSTLPPSMGEPPIAQKSPSTRTYTAHRTRQSKDRARRRPTQKRPEGSTREECKRRQNKIVQPQEENHRREEGTQKNHHQEGKAQTEEQDHYRRAEGSTGEECKGETTRPQPQEETHHRRTSLKRAEEDRRRTEPNRRRKSTEEECTRRVHHSLPVHPHRYPLLTARPSLQSYKTEKNTDRAHPSRRREENVHSTPYSKSKKDLRKRRARRRRPERTQPQEEDNTTEDKNHTDREEPYTAEGDTRRRNRTRRTQETTQKNTHTRGRTWKIEEGRDRRKRSPLLSFHPSTLPPSMGEHPTAQKSPSKRTYTAQTVRQEQRINGEQKRIARPTEEHKEEYNRTRRRKKNTEECTRRVHHSLPVHPPCTLLPPHSKTAQPDRREEPRQTSQHTRKRRR
ncbi:MAG: hypothetical protein ABSF68_17015, partial [Candidatus Acidiferrales bacterium]